MSASRGPRLSALWWSLLGVTLVTAPASAQFMDGARQTLSPFPRPIDRSPRLLGMGKMTLADDPNNGLTMWDFAGNPIGIWEADTVSDVQVRPSLESADGGQNLALGDDRERQTLGANGTDIAYEMVHRGRSGTAYGAYGTLSGLKLDRPYDSDTGVQRSILSPNVVALMTGRLPHLAPGHMRWMLRGSFLNSNTDLSYHEIISNPGGSFVGLTGDKIPPPDLFTPETNKINATGFGVGLAYRFGPWLTLAANGDNLTTKIRGENESVRHFSQQSENRPYWIAQSTANGKFGTSFDWIVDGRLWRARNEETWNFTLAAGIQQEPLTGRGFMLQRTEDGSTLKSRVRWSHGGLVLGAGAETRYGQVEIVGPKSDDLTSFNHFINTVSARQNADSLVLPDSVRSDVAQQHNLAWSAGGTYRLGWHSALAAAEFHWDRQRHDQRLQGPGPEGQGWDVRGGFELPCTRILTSRLGYVYRNDDYDRFTARNEYISHTATAGVTLANPKTRWQLDAGYTHTWSSPDFADAFEGWSIRQQFQVQVRWGF